MFRSIKTKVVVIALVAMLLTFLTQGTLAYYTAIGTATNVVTSGDISLVIHETTADGTEFPSEGVYVMPGDVVSKQVTIENICDHPFYLRVKLVYGVNAQELSAEDCFALNIDDSTWLFHDGWYYYNGIVDPHETTPYVFSHAEIVGDKVDNNYIGKTLSLTVKAQAVQSENNPLIDGDIITAAGWPAE